MVIAWWRGCQAGHQRDTSGPFVVTFGLRAWLRPPPLSHLYLSASACPVCPIAAGSLHSHLCRNLDRCTSGCGDFSSPSFLDPKTGCSGSSLERRCLSALTPAMTSSNKHHLLLDGLRFGHVTCCPTTRVPAASTRFSPQPISTARAARLTD